MMSILIIGAGSFGHRAAVLLGREYPSAGIQIVDQDVDRLKSPDLRAFDTVAGDGVAYLEERLKEADPPTWVVPAAPVHVAFEWIRRCTADDYRIEILDVPEAVLSILPNIFKGQQAQVYVSNADFICPPDCPEPEEICTYTGEPRPRILHDFLASIAHAGFRSVVIRSEQLLPGVGGYRPAALFDALKAVTAVPGSLFFSTACKCHGVLQAFRIEKK